MLTIRDEQLGQLSSDATSRFERQLAAHARAFAPKHAEVLGEAGVLAAARLAMERGGAYGFTGQGPLQLYLELMFLLGSFFDTDVQYPWAGRILAPSTPGGQMDKADRLHAAAAEYWDAVAGPGNQFAQQALRTLNQSGTAVARGLQPGPAYVPAAAQALAGLYPQKAQYLGMPVLESAVEASVRECEARSVRSVPAWWVITVLHGTLGHGISQDPLYPWVGKALDNEREGDPDERVKKVYSKAKIYMTEAIAYLEGRKL
ncbi:MAG: hypothetical protein IT162_10195 [Bryobacterales bacterium]|nr:hypothetical protein [Bryobacterales bacterium]